MKTLIILALALALAAALFLTRPQKADFEQHVRSNPQIAQGQAGGKSIVEKGIEQFRTFTAGAPARDPVESYLGSVTYDNYFLWTNVKKDGKVIFTGAVNHWFDRRETQPAQPAQPSGESADAKS